MHRTAGTAALFLALTAPLAAQETGPLDRLRDVALEAVNADRAAQGLDPLTGGDRLDRIAQAHAEDMAQRGFYAHRNPDGQGARDRYLEAGGPRWELVAENIARCTGCATPPDAARVEAFQEGWMNSPEHRENILTEGLTRMGFGIVAAGEQIFAVQDFAGPGGSRGGDPLEDSTAATARVLDLLNTAREEAGAPPLTSDPALIEAAEALIPEDGALDRMGNLGQALPEGARGDWRQLAALAAACGGCGTAITAGDVEAFADDWLSGGDRARLTDGALTHAGLALQADGQGRKVAVLVLGQAR